MQLLKPASVLSFARIRKTGSSKRSFGGKMAITIQYDEKVVQDIGGTQRWSRRVSEKASWNQRLAKFKAVVSGGRVQARSQAV